MGIFGKREPQMTEAERDLAIGALRNEAIRLRSLKTNHTNAGFIRECEETMAAMVALAAKLEAAAKEGE